MNEREFRQLLETARVRALTPEEHARLTDFLLTRPGEKLEWEMEEQISAALRHLPDVPMAPNFTDRVLAAVERDPSPAAGTRPAALIPWWRQFWLTPRFAGVAVGLAVTGLSAWQFGVRERERVAESVRQMGIVASFSDVEVLRDFEVIQRLSQLPPPGDADLLKVLR